MELNLSVSRLLQLAALVAAFWYLAGFTPPPVETHEFYDARRLGEAWFRCVVLFLSGAVAATVVDHYVGNLDRSNLRLLYILLGILLMGGSLLWLHSLKQAVTVKALVTVAF